MSIHSSQVPSAAMNGALRKAAPALPVQRARPDRVVIRNELLKLAGLAALFAAVMVMTAWGSGFMNGL